MKIFQALQIKKFDLPVNYNKLSSHMRRVVREEYVKEQKGACHHCGELLGQSPPPNITELFVKRELFPDGFFDHPIHLHHDHRTGMTIGAVHAWCNAVLWQYHGE